MKTLLLALCMTLGASQAMAISRYNSTSMTCAAVQDLLRAEGAAILRHQSRRVPGLMLYDRYVAAGSYCPFAHVAERATVPTADARSCPVLNCKPKVPQRRFLYPYDD